MLFGYSIFSNLTLLRHSLLLQLFTFFIHNLQVAIVDFSGVVALENTLINKSSYLLLINAKWGGRGVCVWGG